MQGFLINCCNFFFIKGCRDGSLAIWWDGGNVREEKKHQTSIQEIQLVNEKYFIARSRSNGIVLSLWDFDNFLDGFEIDPQNSTTCLSTVNDQVALGTASGSVYVFNLSDERKLCPVHTLKPETSYGPVRVVRFNHEGKVLVTGHDVGTIEVHF